MWGCPVILCLGKIRLHLHHHHYFHYLRLLHHYSRQLMTGALLDRCGAAKDFSLHESR